MNAQDLKETAKLDCEKVKNSSILQGINPDADMWMDALAYDKNVDENEDYTNIKNWLRYRICSDTNMNLYTVSNFDCDTTEDALNHCDELLKNAGFTPMHTGKNKRHITVVDNGIPVELETDTMNSMGTLFNAFMRDRMKSKYGNAWYRITYMNEFGLKKASEPCRDIYFLLKAIDELKADPSNEEILKEFNTLARLTHTVDNITLVPRGYNKERGGWGSKTKDFWDLSLMEIEDRATRKSGEEAFTFTWWYEHKSIFVPSVWYNGEEVSPLYDGHSLSNNKPEKDSDLIACLGEMNARIPIRTQ